MLWPQKWISRALKTAGQSDAKINRRMSVERLMTIINKLGSRVEVKVRVKQGLKELSLA